MNSLEDRLAETETALYSALTTIDSMSQNDTGLSQLVTTLSSPLSHERSKIEKQDEWKRLPLRNGEQLQAWFEEKSRLDSHRRHGPTIQSPLNVSHNTMQIDNLADNREFEVAGTSVESAPTDTAVSSYKISDKPQSDQFQDSAQWRNYF